MPFEVEILKKKDPCKKQNQPNKKQTKQKTQTKMKTTQKQKLKLKKRSGILLLSSLMYKRVEVVTSFLTATTKIDELKINNFS